MNLQLLNSLLAEYKASLNNRADNEWHKPWKSLEMFDYHWDIEAREFDRMFDDSFGGDCYLWEGEDFHPKSSMLYYSTQNPDLVRSMFIDLFDENRDIVGRIHRFVDQCDQLRTYHSKGITKRESHYHGDRKMVFVYLAFRYPEKYTLYEGAGFRKLLEQVNAKPLGPVINIDRYIKTSKTINTLMQRDEEVANMLVNLSKSLPSNAGTNMLYVFDFYRFINHVNAR